MPFSLDRLRGFTKSPARMHHQHPKEMRPDKIAGTNVG